MDFEKGKLSNFFLLIQRFIFKTVPWILYLVTLEKINKRDQEKAGKYNNTMSWLGSSMPKEWEEKTKQLYVKWEQVQRNQSKTEQQDNSVYEDSRFMFEDGIVPYPSQLCANNNKDGSYGSLSLFSFEDLLIEKQRKELMQRVHVFANQVMHAPRDSSKRLPVFKDIAPN